MLSQRRLIQIPQMLLRSPCRRACRLGACPLGMRCFDREDIISKVAKDAGGHLGERGEGRSARRWGRGGFQGTVGLPHVMGYFQIGRSIRSPCGGRSRPPGRFGHCGHFVIPRTSDVRIWGARVWKYSENEFRFPKRILENLSATR